MAHLLQNLQNYFVLVGAAVQQCSRRKTEQTLPILFQEELNIDSWTFKLFYKVSSALCMLGATLGAASQYFGNPIR